MSTLKAAVDQLLSAENVTGSIEHSGNGLMNRRAFLKAVGSATLLPILPRRVWASTNFSRRRPSDAAWPSRSAWKGLDDAVGGNLIPVNFPLSLLKTDPTSAAAKLLSENIRNPYYIGDQPGLTQTLGWLDAWATKPSVYAVAARNAKDIAEAVNLPAKMTCDSWSRAVATAIRARPMRLIRF
jgi:hypothetical protein